VIGGGLIGLNAGLALQARGLAVILANDSPAIRPASWGNAGRIAVELSEPLASVNTLKALPSSLFLRGGPASFPLRAIGAWLPFGLRLVAASSPKHCRRGGAVWLRSARPSSWSNPAITRFGRIPGQLQPA
jgi:glycine/D-amino acid oxidase-like deaminating enzyme